jgi:fumarate hydratase class II
MGEQELFVARQKVVKLVRAHRGAIIRLATDLLAIATDEGVMVDGPRLAALLDADGSGILRRVAV